MREVVGGVGCLAKKCRASQSMNDFLEGRKREGWVGELRNVAHCKTRTHLLEGRKREEQVGELGNMACRKKRTHFLEGRKRGSKLVSSETWNAGNEDSLSGGEKGGGMGW